MHRIENKLKTIPFCTIKEATEARAIISLIKKMRITRLLLRDIRD